MRAIALIKTPDHVCARYRLAAFAPALGDAGCSLTFAAIPRDPLRRLRLFSKVVAFDVVFLQRRLLPAYQLKYLRRNARRFIFDFDDAVFYRDSYHPIGIASSRRERRFGNVMRAADSVIAGNNFLKEHAVASGAAADSVHVIPTCVDPGRYPLANHHPKETLDLVWIGSSFTLHGIERRRDLLGKLAARFPKLRLRLICDRFPKFARPPMLLIRWGAPTEAAEIAASDIGISWVPDDPWSKGKCGLKILQYYAAGLPVIANPVGVHGEMIQSGITGALADSDEQWIDAIGLLAEPAVRRRMGKAARQCAEQRYSVAAHRDRFVEVVTRCARADRRSAALTGREDLPGKVYLNQT